MLNPCPHQQALQRYGRHESNCIVFDSMVRQYLDEVTGELRYVVPHLWKARLQKCSCGFNTALAAPCAKDTSFHDCIATQKELEAVQQRLAQVERELSEVRAKWQRGSVQYQDQSFTVEQLKSRCAALMRVVEAVQRQYGGEGRDLLDDEVKDALTELAGES